jgi:hypothetical protein
MSRLKAAPTYVGAGVSTYVGAGVSTYVGAGFSRLGS